MAPAQPNHTISILAFLTIPPQGCCDHGIMGKCAVCHYAHQEHCNTPCPLNHLICFFQFTGITPVQLCSEGEDNGPKTQITSLYGKCRINLFLPLLSPVIVRLRCSCSMRNYAIHVLLSGTLNECVMSVRASLCMSSVSLSSQRCLISTHNMNVTAEVLNKIQALI